jgi:Flp pilus assembly protein TadB
MREYIKQPMFWGWFFLVIWLAHVIFTLFAARWVGLTISLVGLVGMLLVMSAIMSRRRKNMYPDKPAHNLGPDEQIDG